MNFVTLFRHTQNVHLVKDVGQVPFHLQKEFGINAKIVSYKIDKEYPYLDTLVKGFEIEFLKNKGGIKFFDFAFVQYLFRNAKSIDVLNLYHYQPDTLFYGLLYKFLNQCGFLYLKMDDDLRDIRTHNTLYFTRNFFMQVAVNILSHFFNRAVDLATIETTQGKQLIEKRYSVLHKKLVLLPDGIDFEQVDSKIKFEQRKNTKKEHLAVTVGRLGMPQKNNEMLLDAIAKLDLKDWKFMFIGPIEKSFQPKVDSFFKEHPKLRNSVIFTGNIADRNKLYDILFRAQVFCLTSRWESFGFVLLEAILAGCFIVSTELASLKDLFSKPNMGIATPQEDSNAYAQILQKIINNPSDYLPNIEENISIVKNNYNWKTIVKTLYSEITRRKK